MTLPSANRVLSTLPGVGALCRKPVALGLFATNCIPCLRAMSITVSMPAVDNVVDSLIDSRLDVPFVLADMDVFG